MPLTLDGYTCSLQTTRCLKQSFWLRIQCVIPFEFMVVINYTHRGADIEQRNTTDSGGI